MIDDVVGTNSATVVICWEHDQLVKWLDRFAADRRVTARDGGQLPQRWPDDCFDVLWVLERIRGEPDTYWFSQRDQGLLAPDPRGLAGS